jgi:3,4-dihydroxy-2-butanone 4-phosphate synthase
MARGRDLQAFCRRHDLPVVTVEHIAGYVRALTPAVTAV